MEVTSIFLASVILVVLCYWFLRHDSRLPPCPVPPLPLVGHLLYLDKDSRPQFKRWRKKCGDIYSLYLGRNLVVVLNGYDLVKEALVKNGEVCSDRPYTYYDAYSAEWGSSQQPTTYCLCQCVRAKPSRDPTLLLSSTPGNRSQLGQVNKNATRSLVMEVTSIFLASVILVVLCYWLLRHDSRLPPCPVPPLPLVGHLPYLDKESRPQFKQWRKKCGDIYSLYLGRNLVVVLNGYDLVKEALVKNGEVCSDRPYTYFDAVTGAEGRGIGFSSGKIWKEQRAVTMNILRSLGMGKNVLVDRVAEIAAINNEILASMKGEPTNINSIITTSIANVICSVIIGHRFSHDDKQFIKLCDKLRSIATDAEGTSVVNFFPFLTYLPGDLFGAKRIREKAKFVMENFVASFVKQKGYDEFDENNLDNYIALYVYEMKKKEKSGEPTTMNLENLGKNIYDIFGAGVDTISTTLMWCILYMLNYPLIQDKIYHEIEKEVGTERLPNMSDRTRLPYLNAVILEVERLSSVVPLNLTHLCSDDVIIGGYILPKGTQIIPSLDSILFDKKIWGEDADCFRPERFIDEHGKVRYPEEFVPFSMGKRICAGEAMAKVELFMFFSAVIQRFKFLPADPSSPPPIKALFGLTATPVPYEVRVIDRKLQK